jgi:hypothetical protein
MNMHRRGALKSVLADRFELEYENEGLRQQWAKSPGHQRVWPLIERTITTRTD